MRHILHALVVLPEDAVRSEKFFFKFNNVQRGLQHDVWIQRNTIDALLDEVIELLGITQEEYSRILSEALGSRLISVDDMDANGEELQGDSGPLEEVTKQGFLEGVTQAVKNLPKREQMVLSLYYDEELNMREIGEVLEVSESRVCQIHSQAMLRLRARLQDWQ